MAFDEEYWSKDEDELIADFEKQGYSKERAIVMVGAVLNAFHGEGTAKRSSNVGWTRVQAPGSGTDHDPSPDSLDAARRQG